MRYSTDASKSGVAQETLQNTVRRASKAMTEQEARQILGVSEQTAWEEIMKVSISCIFILSYLFFFFFFFFSWAFVDIGS
jgi:predicted DNA-binding protein (UPF0251 family)